MMNLPCLALLSTCFFGIAATGGCAEPEKRPKGPIVAVEKTADGCRLLRGGRPYVIRGAGGSGSLERLKQAGGNSTRTWGADKQEALLDQAQALGLSVTLGIWLGHERHGFNYADEAAVTRQREQAREHVRRYKDHPALLLWGVGNEMEGKGDNPRIWRAVNDIARMIKEVDGSHPTMTVLAEISAEKIRMLNTHCPDIDILGVNSYGGLASLPKRLQEFGWRKPYVVTEFGTLGPWEVGKTAWGAPREPTSTEKAARYLSGYRTAVAEQPGRCLGSYAFHWGHKQEATATWFGMLLPTGETLGAVDAMTYAWTGQWPANRAPRIQTVETPAKEREVAPGAQLTAKVVADDPEGDRLRVRWEVRSESTDRRQGGDREAAPPAHPESIVAASGTDLTFKAPAWEGAYRLFVYVYDDRGGAATANVPFFVRKG